MNIKKLLLCFMVLITYSSSASVSNSVTGSIGGLLPYSLAITPDNSTLFTTNYSGSNVSAFSISDITLLGIVKDVDGYIINPQSIAITPDGTIAYVTCNTTIPNGLPGNLGGVAIIDVTTRVVIGLVTDISTPTFNAPYDIAITSDGLYAYVTNQNGNTVSIIDCKPDSSTYNTVIGTVSDLDSLLYGSTGIAITPNAVNDNYYAYVCNYSSNKLGTVSIIDLTPSNTTYNTVIGNVDFSDLSIALNKPVSVAFSPYPIGGMYYAYVVDCSGNSVYAIIVNSNTGSYIIGGSSDATFSNPNYIDIESTGTYAYVVNQTGGPNVTGFISIITLSDKTVTAQISDYNIYTPYACAVSPDSQYLYVSNDGINAITQIELSINEVVQVINPFTIMNFPIALAISPDGTMVYVCNTNGGGSGYGYINALSIPNSLYLDVIYDPDGVLNPVSITLTQDGSTAYIADQILNNVGIIDCAGNTVSGSISGINSPSYITLNVDDSKLYVATSDNIIVIDTATNSISTTIADTYNTISFAINPSTIYAYAILNGSTSVTIIDTTTDTVTDITINDPNGLLTNPRFIAISPDGNTAYVINNGNQIVNIDLVTNTVIGLIADSNGSLEGSSMVVFTPDGSTAYVTNTAANMNTTPYSYTISIIDTAFAKVTGTITDVSLQTPYAMAITSDGTIGYVVNNSGNSISIVSI